VAGVVLVRADDHLILGVRWSGFAVSGTGTTARLTAGAQARILILMPPQHVAEETSPSGSAAPQQLSTGGGTTVPAWRGVLSAPTRLAFEVSAGTQIPLTSEGVLAAVMDRPLLVSADAPGPDNTAIELPWRLIIAPSGRSAAGKVVCRHPIRAASADSSALWRTRLVDQAVAADATLLDANLTVKVVDPTTAGAADPAFGPNNSIPLARADRLRLVTETGHQPARVSRLELSALGGTLDAAGVFPNFEWEHRTVLGRDMHVRTLARGAMYPLGHRAEFLQVAERVYDPSAGGAAVLRSMRVLTIVEPVRHAPADGPIRRAFPLGDVEITRTVFTDLAPPVWQATTLPGVGTVNTHFSPTTLAGDRPVRFPVACTTSTGVVHLDLPMLFVADLRPTVASLTSPVLAQRLAADYGANAVPIPPTNIDLVGAATDERARGDMHEVHSLTIAGVKDGLNLADGYRGELTELEVALPALRALRGDDRRPKVAFAKKYLQNGAAEDLLLEMLPNQAVPIDFTKAADRSGGLVAPKYVTNGISRSFGPIDRFSLPNPATGFIDPRSLFRTDDASLLGFPLRSLLTELKLPPEITATPITGSAPEVRMQWKDVKLADVGPFKAKPTTRLALTVTIAPNKADTECLVRDFTLELPPGPKRVLRLSFATMKFTQHDGKSPQLDVEGVNAEFLGDLKLLEKLRDVVDLGAAGRLIDVRPTGIAVRYSLPVPSVASGAFVMRNMVFTAGIEVPFDGKPVSVSLAFASRTNPFQLAVMMFGGGGYIELALDRDGLKRFEASLEFGAFFAVDFLIASGEVHALGGVRFVLERGRAVTITGYLRIGGCVEVLGLISVSIELCLSLSYRSERNALVGRATLVIEIDLTLWSDSVELDSGEWVLAGGDERHRPLAAAAAASPDDDMFSLWRTYRAAFADEDARSLSITRALQYPDSAEAPARVSRDVNHPTPAPSDDDGRG
jgi:hypothetical protein